MLSVKYYGLKWLWKVRKKIITVDSKTGSLTVYKKGTKDEYRWIEWQGSRKACTADGMTNAKDCA
jgi:hypothetical protein